MERKIQKGAILIFSAGFGLVWALVCLIAVSGMNESKQLCLRALLFFGALVCAVLLGERVSRNVKNQKGLWRALALFVLLLMGGGLFYAGRELGVSPSWDFGAVYQGAVEIVRDGQFSQNSNWYFTTYPNNLAVCLFLSLFFKLFGSFASYVTLGIILNIVLILTAMVFTFFLAERLYGSRGGFFVLLCCALFLPFYMHAPIFYTDTFALPFVTGAFYFYQKRKKAAWWLLLAALFLGVGYKVKGSLGVILVAFLIHIWLHREAMQERIKKSVLLVVPFLLLVGFLTIVPQKMPFFDASDREKNEFPLEHWFAMGLAGSGGYNSDVYWMTASTEGKAEKKEVDRAFIRKTLEDYGTAGMQEHLKKKISFTWGDGVYFAPEKLKREPLKESRLHSWFLYDGPNYQKTYRYCNAVQVLLLAGILLSVICNFIFKGEVREIQALQLSVLGLFLFLLMWETRSRYLVNFVPIFILLGMDGAIGIKDIIKRILPVKSRLTDE